MSLESRGGPGEKEGMGKYFVSLFLRFALRIREMSFYSLVLPYSVRAADLFLLCLCCSPQEA